MTARIDMAGKRFGQWSVTGFAGLDRNKRALWSCRCDCGRQEDVGGKNLRRGQTKSCGCLLSQTTSFVQLSGARSLPVPMIGSYRSWRSMIIRCTNPKHDKFKFYGARGITICSRWRTFENFFADMGSRPVGKTLDRRDNDGNYEPGNCGWATQKEQCANRRARQ